MTKILLVEDDKNLREIYSVRLSAEGYQVISSGNGEEALAAAVGEKPDLIVSDVMMPKISGFEMLDLLKSNDATKGIPVIMLTALSSETQRDRGDNLGADRYLVKSQVGLEDIIRTVHEVLIEYGIEKAQTPGASSDQVASETEPSDFAPTTETSSVEMNNAAGVVSGASAQSASQPARSTISEPIINNPSILGTNFASVADAAPTPFDIGDVASNGGDNNDSSNINNASNTTDGVFTVPVHEATQALPSEPVAQPSADALPAQPANIAAPSAGQSAFNPSTATHPAMAAGVPAPQMPDTPMRVPMPIGNNQPLAVAQPVPQSQMQSQQPMQTSTYNVSQQSAPNVSAASQVAPRAISQPSVPTPQTQDQATIPMVQTPSLATSNQMETTGAERTIQPVERRTPRIDIDSLLNGAS